MTVDRILVGVDFSPESDRAIEHTLSIATKAGASVSFLHAVAEGPEPPDLEESDAQTLEELKQRHLAVKRDELASLASRVAGREIPTRVVYGLPDTEIAEAATEMGCDLVVVGSRGLTGFERVMLGSVAERVVRLCESRVLVARGKAPDSAGYNHILVPTDFSRAARRALSTAIDLVAPGGVIELLHLWRPPFDANTSKLRAAIARGIEDEGERLVDELRERHPKISFDHEQDAPLRGILERLESTAYDLVVMGSHGRRGVRRFILGSVAEATVRHASCSVLVVH